MTHPLPSMNHRVQRVSLVIPVELWRRLSLRPKQGSRSQQPKFRLQVALPTRRPHHLSPRFQALRVRHPSLCRRPPAHLKASGFGSLSGSATSGFGAIGKSSRGFGSGGGFATGRKSPTPVRQEARVVKETETAKPAPSSVFGDASGQKSTFAAAGIGSSSSPFSSGASAFGKLGQSSSGFGGTGLGGLGGASGLTSFASGKPSSALIGSSKPAKTFWRTRGRRS